MDPAFIALFMTVGIAMMLRLMEHLLLQKKSLGPVAPVQALPAKSEYDCEVYDTRQFERRLVAAGIMESVAMTMCEDAECPECKPTRIHQRSVGRSNFDTEARMLATKAAEILAREKYKQANNSKWQGRGIPNDGYIYS